jgi:hypothetical protein
MHRYQWYIQVLVFQELYFSIPGSVPHFAVEWNSNAIYFSFSTYALKDRIFWYQGWPDQLGVGGVTPPPNVGWFGPALSGEMILRKENQRRFAQTRDKNIEIELITAFIWSFLKDFVRLQKGQQKHKFLSTLFCRISR